MAITNKKRKICNTKLALAIVTGWLGVSSMAWAQSAVEFPTFDWQPDCSSSSSCHEFSVKTDLIPDKQASSPAATSENKVKGSYAWQYAKYTIDDPQKFSNQTLIAHDLTGVTSVFYTVTAFMCRGSDKFDNNQLIVTSPNTSPLIVDWTGTDSAPEAWDTGNMSAATATYATQMNSNTLAIQNVTFNLSNPPWRDLLVLSAAGVAGMTTDDTNKQSSFSHNRTILEKVTIQGKQKGITQASGIYGFQCGRYQHQYPEPTDILLDGNGVFIKDSNIEIGSIRANYVYSWEGKYTTRNSIVWLEDSSIGFNYSDEYSPTWYDSTAVGYLTAAIGGTHSYDNQLYFKNLNFHYSNALDDTHLSQIVIAATYKAQKIVERSHTTISDSTLTFEGDKNTVIIYGGSLADYEKDVEHTISDSSIVIKGEQKRTTLAGQAFLNVMAARLMNVGSALNNQLALSKVDVENPGLLPQ